MAIIEAAINYRLSMPDKFGNPTCKRRQVIDRVDDEKGLC